MLNIYKLLGRGWLKLRGVARKRESVFPKIIEFLMQEISRKQEYCKKDKD